MLVVSDTSPIINLASIRHLHLLPELFTEIVIPTAVFDEIAGEGNNEPGSVEVKTASWVKILPALFSLFCPNSFRIWIREKRKPLF